MLCGSAGGRGRWYRGAASYRGAGSGGGTWSVGGAVGGGMVACRGTYPTVEDGFTCSAASCRVGRLGQDRPQLLGEVPDVRFGKDRPVVSGHRVDLHVGVQGGQVAAQVLGAAPVHPGPEHHGGAGYRRGPVPQQGAEAGHEPAAQLRRPAQPAADGADAEDRLGLQPEGAGEEPGGGGDR